MNSRLTVNAYAKLNLFLDIVGRRPNGYHDIVSVMQRIDLCDRITVESIGDGIHLTCDDQSIPADETNTAYRAARLFLKETGVCGGVSVRIEKHIPIGGGLGGSSADAAGVLIGMNALFNTGYSVPQLCEMGAKIGADVPFCIHGGTALCEGIGDIIRPLPFLQNCWFVVVQPDFSFFTKNAYEIYDKTPFTYPKHSPNVIIDAIQKNDINTVAKTVYNIFEVLYQNERITSVCTQIKEAGAIGVSMTGSGSCVFGVFLNEESAKKAAIKLPFQTKFVCTSKE